MVKLTKRKELRERAVEAIEALSPDQADALLLLILAKRRDDGDGAAAAEFLSWREPETGPELEPGANLLALIASLGRIGTREECGAVGRLIARACERGDGGAIEALALYLRWRTAS